MFQPVSTPDGGMTYWKRIIEHKRTAQKEAIERKAARRREKAAKKAEYVAKKKVHKKRSFRDLVRLAAQDRLKSSQDTSRESVEYKAWRRAVMERDGFRCVKCGATENIIAHHIKGWADHPELRLKVSNGVTTCADCHGLRHDWLGTSPEMQHLRSIATEAMENLEPAHA